MSSVGGTNFRFSNLRPAYLPKGLEKGLPRGHILHGPGPALLRSTNLNREASCALAQHLCSLRLIRRLPATSVFRPTQPAHGSPHGGDGNPDSLLALPQLAVVLQGSVVVLFDLLPQSAALLDGGADRKCTSGEPSGTYLSSLSS